MESNINRFNFDVSRLLRSNGSPRSLSNCRHEAHRLASRYMSNLKSLLRPVMVVPAGEDYDGRTFPHCGAQHSFDVGIISLTAAVTLREDVIPGGRMIGHGP